MTQDPPADLWSRGGLDEMASLLSVAAAEGRFLPDPLIPFETTASRDVFETYRRHLFGE